MGYQRHSSGEVHHFMTGTSIEPTCIQSFTSGGLSGDRCLCHSSKQEMSHLLLWAGSLLSRRWPSSPMEWAFPPYVPITATNYKEPTKMQREKPWCILITPWWLHQLWFSALLCWPLWIFFSSILKYSGISQYHPSQTDGMVDSALGFSEKIWHILINFRKPLYASKWFCFFSFLWGSGLGPAMAGLPTMSDFLISLHEGVFGHCSLKVYLAAIAVFHVQIEDYSVFSHPLLKHFLKGFLNLSPPVPAQLVFCHLTGHLLPPSSNREDGFFTGHHFCADSFHTDCFVIPHHSCLPSTWWYCSTCIRGSWYQRYSAVCLISHNRDIRHARMCWALAFHGSKCLSTWFLGLFCS